MPADVANLDPSFQQKLDALIAASHGRVTVTSGFRSDQQQASLYAQAVQKYGEANAGQWVAPPGHSNHNRGLAADLGGDIDLARQLAPQFGLTFPMSWEPWHIEPIGARTTSSPQAYTQGPIGTVNPVDDHTLNTSPANLAASFATALGSPSLPGNDTTSDLVGAPNIAAVEHGQGGTTTAASYSTTPGQGQGGQVKPAALYKMLRTEGLDPVHAAALVSIAGRESGFNPNAYNGNVATGDNSHGLFQINTLGGQHSQYDLVSIPGQVSAAADMVRNGGLQPWGPYKGVSWSNGTDLATGAEASGGEVSVAQLQAITNEGLH